MIESKDIKDLEKDRGNQKAEKRISIITGRIIAFFGILCVAGGLGIIIYQFYFWVKMGQWRAMPFSVLVSKVMSLNYIYKIEWKGMAGLLIWITYQSSALILIIWGTIIAVIGNVIYLRSSKDYKESPWRK